MDQHIPSYITSPRIREVISEEWPGYHPDWRAIPQRCTEEDIPELIRIATDMEVFYTDDLWEMGVMAWYELGRFGSERCHDILPPLLELFFHPWGEAYGWDDLRSEELPGVLASLGTNLPEIFDEIVVDPASGYQQTWPIIETFRRIVRENPENRDAIVGRATDALKRHDRLDEKTNAGLVGLLIDLEAIESIDVVREVYHAGNAAVDFTGDLEDVEIAFGVRKKRSTPRPRYNQDLLPPGLGELVDQVIAHQRDEAHGHKPIHKEKKIGRNDPCPCGSGKKYKKCCLNRT